MKGKFISHELFADLKPINVFHTEYPQVTVPNATEEYADKHVLFRKKFNVCGDLFKAVLKIAADDYFKLYINGEFVTQGPPPSYPQAYHYMELPVGNFLRSGENVIAVHTLYQGLINRVWVSGDNRESLWAELTVGGNAILVTDESWKCKISSAYVPLSIVGYDTQYMELFDSRSEDTGFEKIILTMESNMGGSGGFYAGIKKAMEQEADWIWVSDDDAYLKDDALKQASDYLEEQPDLDKISAICGKVIKNGKMDINHGKYYYKKGIRICEAYIPAEMYEKKEFEMGSFTYVGTIMNKKKLLEAGLPNKDYFIYWDDLEHGIRMRKAGKIIGVPGIVAYHDVGEEGSGINWKLYYSYRNMIDTYRKHFFGVCYDYFCLKIRVKIFLNHITGHKKLELNILEEAFKNARQQKFGLHPVYRPGWKPGE